jgi:hypothetical protein
MKLKRVADSPYQDSAHHIHIIRRFHFWKTGNPFKKTAISVSAKSIGPIPPPGVAIGLIAPPWQRLWAYDLV